MVRVLFIKFYRVSRETAITDLLGTMNLSQNQDECITLLQGAHEIYRKLKIIREPI